MFFIIIYGIGLYLIPPNFAGGGGFGDVAILLLMLILFIPYLAAVIYFIFKRQK